MLATRVGAGEAAVVADDVDERPAGLDLQIEGPAIEGEV